MILLDMEAPVKLMQRPPRVLFLGMQGNFSLPSLRALLGSSVEVCAVVIPSAPPAPGASPGQPAINRREQPRIARSTLPVISSSRQATIVQLAWERKIPLWEVSHIKDPVTVSTLAAYQPDVICVACFSQRIPRAILDVARLGCLNVHPSLLPANRGPEPLFWTFRLGSKQTGVTIHLMNEGMDSGDILAQESIEIVDGISYAQLESECALRGGVLLARTVWELYEGRAIRVPQDEARSSYHAFPTAEDFVIHADEWSASHVYNFICGVADWGGPVTLLAGGESFAVQKAISYSHEDISTNRGEAYCWRGEELWVRCKIGWVAVMINPTTFQ
jgi:methionyl-tRNA formyltransferase